MKKSLLYSIIFHVFIILILVKVAPFDRVETKKFKKIPITFNTIKKTEKPVSTNKTKKLNNIQKEVPKNKPEKITIPQKKEIKDKPSIKDTKPEPKKDIPKKIPDKKNPEIKKEIPSKKIQKEITTPKKNKASDIFSNISLDDQKEATLLNDEENMIRAQISSHWIKTACVSISEKIKIAAHITSNCEIINSYVVDKDKYDSSSEYATCADSTIRALQKIKKLAFKPNRCKELNNKKIPLAFFP
ncbi:MAG: outer membrane biosynthesis protein TonB [Candidatus Midichloriaceae bacterium]|jgi:outer membrane biosynthesis protein TonB